MYLMIDGDTENQRIDVSAMSPVCMQHDEWHAQRAVHVGSRIALLSYCLALYHRMHRLSKCSGYMARKAYDITTNDRR
jgi:hypothetical protein